MDTSKILLDYVFVSTIFGEFGPFGSVKNGDLDETPKYTVFVLLTDDMPDNILEESGNFNYLIRLIATKIESKVLLGKALSLVSSGSLNVPNKNWGRKMFCA